MKNYKGIYGYWDNEKNEVVYVGKDSNMGKKARGREHLSPSKRNSQPINRVLQNNPDRYEYYEICNLPMDASDDELNHYEKFYIAKYNPKHNHTPGGEGSCTDYTPSAEIRAKLSESKKGEKNPNYGKPAWNRGISPSHESKIKMSKSQNTTGYYRVSKVNKPDAKNGYAYLYQYYENGKSKRMLSVDIKKLEAKVKAKGLEWRKL